MVAERRRDIHPHLDQLLRNRTNQLFHWMIEAKYLSLSSSFFCTPTIMSKLDALVTYEGEDKVNETKEGRSRGKIKREGVRRVIRFYATKHGNRVARYGPTSMG